MPATGALIGTPASMSDSVEPQTEPIDVDPLDDTDYDSARFQLVIDFAADLTPQLGGVRSLTYERETGELDNDADDDGDGLVDEGRIVMTDDAGRRLGVVANVESLTIRKSGRSVTVTVTSAMSQRPPSSHTS